MDEETQDYRKHPFNERLVEMLRGKRGDIFDILYPEESPKPVLPPLCMQYNLRQKPKSSYGIAFYNVKTRRWFMIEPRTTIEMRSIVRGFYSPTSLAFLIDQLYEEELEYLSELEGPETFEKTFSTYYSMSMKDDFQTRIARTFWKRDWGMIRELCRRLRDYKRDHPEHSVMQRIFPKGRPLDGEPPLTAAIRELTEETGIKIIFENPNIAIKNLTRGCGGMVSRTTVDPDDPFNTILVPRSGFWESCCIDFHGGMEELIQGYICKEFVTHYHSDINGRIYKTSLWICAFDLDEDPEIPLDPSNYESRGGKWVDENELRTTSRVSELSQKCETCLNKYFPYLII